MEDDNKKLPKGVFSIREQMGSLEAMRKYDAYLKEHRLRLRQLEKLARGEMCPADEWYREA